MMQTLFSRSARCLTALLAFLMLAVTLNVGAQEKSLYRYTDADGRLVYSDKPPPADAKNAQVQRSGGNFIETDKISAGTRQAMTRFPVTLYAFACGALCQDAEALLQKRGIPYTYVNTQEPAGNDKLKKLTGGLDVPTLQVGDDYAKGFQETQWQQMLDRAGYAQNAGVKATTMHTAAPPPDAPSPTAPPPAASMPAGGIDQPSVAP